MTTQKFMGRNQIVKRLTAQVGDKEMAVGILQKHGLLKPDGKTLTKLGQERNSMTAKERALDRAAKAGGRSSEDYKYNKQVNRAVLKTGK